MDSIGSEIPKTGVITAEPLYHAQVCEYPPRVLSFLERGPDFTNLQRKGSQILTILTRTTVADENLKVSISPSDDF